MLCIACLQGVAILSLPRPVRSNRYNLMPGPITTVLDEHNRPKELAAPNINHDTWRWFTESGLGAIFVHPNHPIKVRLSKQDT